ncbi:MAG TPA: hypothetical protein VNE83_04785 [Terriglobales bacterium]|nr:hypothetical protein [Terriglobales bacterium]
MNFPGLNSRTPARPAWIFYLLLALTALAAGCNQYYTPPPPVAVSLASPSAAMVITTTDPFGNTVPATLQLQGTVINSSNTNIIYSVGTLGNFTIGGDATVGTISSTGLYTAPTVLPASNNVITVQAVAVADPTQKATTSITLLNPAATITSVTPSIVTAGQSYTFDLRGTDFAAGATLNLSGAQIGTPQIVGSTEISVTARVTASGLLSLNVINPDAAGNSNAVALRSQPAAPATSSANAVLIGEVDSNSGGAPITATKAYIPEGNTLAVVNLDSGQQVLDIQLPTGFQASIAAADPGPDPSQNQVIVASSSSNIVQIVNAKSDQPIGSWTVPVSTTTTVDGASCEICAMLVDSTRQQAVLDTAAGYFTLDLTTGATTVPIAAPAAANFAYNPQTQRIYAPYANSGGAGVNVIDLGTATGTGTVTAVQLDNGVLYGIGADTAAYDPSTALLTVGDANSGVYLGMNFNNAVSGTAAIQVPATPFSISTACTGTWSQASVEPSSHIGWFANQGGCVGLAVLPQAPANGEPGQPSLIRWAQLPIGPDGLPWVNSSLGQPQSLAVYVGPDGHIYGLAVRDSGAELIKVDLNLMQAAPKVSGGGDVNQVDPTHVQISASGTTASALTFITLH